MPFSTKCHFCVKKFKTSTSLFKHLRLKHSRRGHETVVFKDENDVPVQEPKPAVIDQNQRTAYLNWLCVVTERINEALIPDCPAKWCSIDCFQVPSQYFAHILHFLDNPWLDSVRETRHPRQPVFSEKTTRLSYKIYEGEKFKRLLEEQDHLSLKQTALYCNDEVWDIADMDMEEALAFAKLRAKQPKIIARPTSRSAIEIGLGEGRRTREVEFIWWPNLYLKSNYGKLTIRFFIHKTSM